MSREVMGALDDTPAPSGGRTGSLTDTPDQGPATLRLDDDPVDHGRVTVRRHSPPAAEIPDTATTLARAEQAGRSATDGEGGGPSSVDQMGTVAGLWQSVRHLVQHPRSRTPAVALVVVTAVVGGLLGAAVAQRAALMAREQNASVIAWITFGSFGASNGSGTFNLFVVNSGPTALTVIAADLQGGIEDGRRAVDVRLERSFDVDPGKAGQAILNVTSACDAGPLSQGGARDGELRVTVTTQDLREQVLSVPNLADMSLSSVAIYESICSSAFTPAVEPTLAVRADGRLSLSVRSTDGEGHEIDLRAPDGTTLVTEPELPLTLTGRQGQSVAIAITVDACTQNNTQLLAGQQVRLRVDGEEIEWFADTTPLLAWFAREVGKVCGE